jgi:branched-chain amino acid transport system ATP-binding protein
MLRLKEISAGYGAIQVIDHLSLEVATGETVALLGPNGAGKSTLLAAIAGVLHRRSGEVWLDDRNLAGAEPHIVVAAGIALVPEGRRVFAPLTVHDNLRLGALRLARSASQEERFRYVFGLFPRLEERRHQLAGTLSGGEQQMLAIARALMSSPRVLLLDEPFLGLAPRIVDEIRTVLQGLAQGGLTVLLVEQKMDVALALSRRAYVMVKGRIVRTGAAQEIAQLGDLSELYFALPEGHTPTI